MSRSERRESPLFAKTHDFVVWLLQHTSKFPRQYRHTLTERLEAGALDFQECLGRCLIMKEPLALAEADFALWRIERLLRVADDLGVISHRLLEFAFGSMDELGRLLGAWKKKVSGTA